MSSDFLVRPDKGGISSELKSLARWVVWSCSQGRKLPHSPLTGKPLDITSGRDLGSFEQAWKMFSAKAGFAGVGFVLNGDGIVAADLDHCVQRGELTAGAQAVLQQLNASFVEFSPSGSGVHAWGRSAQGERRSKTFVLHGVNVELYASHRFITVTGRRVPGSNQLERLSELPVFAQWLQASATQPAHKPGSTQETQETQGTQDTKGTKESKASLETQASGAGAENSEFVLQGITLPPVCLPTGPGTRHKALFQLARLLKARCPDASEDQLYAFVRNWHALVIDKIATKQLEVSWSEFLVGWDSVEMPYRSTLDQLLAELPELPAAVGLDRFGELGKDLLRICIALARHGEPFFLSSRIAAEVLGCHFTHVASLLKAMTLRGYLQLVKQGKRSQASEYRLGPELGKSAETDS